MRPGHACICHTLHLYRARPALPERSPGAHRAWRRAGPKQQLGYGRQHGGAGTQQRHSRRSLQHHSWRALQGGRCKHVHVLSRQPTERYSGAVCCLFCALEWISWPDAGPGQSSPHQVSARINGHCFVRLQLQTAAAWQHGILIVVLLLVAQCVLAHRVLTCSILSATVSPCC